MAQPDGVAVGALVCGLASLPFALLFFPVGLLLAVAGIGLGVVALRAAPAQQRRRRGMAVAGLFTGLLGLLLSVAVTVFTVQIFREVDLDAPPEEVQRQLEEELEERGAP